MVNPRSLDFKYLYNGNRPYSDTSEVNATIPIGIRSKGLIVNVNKELWWYKDSVLDNSLVPLALGGGGSGGTGKVYADYGLINVNDSTLRVDTLYISSLERLMKVADSLGVIIAAKPSFGDVRDVVNDSMDYVRSNFQPLENQRLSTTDSVTFSKVYAKTKFVTGEYGNVDGKLEYIDRGSGNVGTLQNTTLTNNRIWSLPDQSGTIALTSDYVTLNTAQTIKGYKTFDTSFTMRHYTDSLNIYDTTRGIVLENTKDATGNSASITPEGDRITPLIRFKNNVWLNNVNPESPNNVIPNASNPTEWVIQQRNYSGSQQTYGSSLEFKYKIGTRDYYTVGKFTKDGFMGNISGLLQVTVGGAAAGGYGYFKIKQSNTESVVLTMGTSGSSSYIKNSSNSGISFTNSTSTIIGSGNIYGVLVKRDGNNIYRVLVGGGDESSTTPASYFIVKGNAYIGGNGNAPNDGLQVVGKTILSGLATNYRYINDSSYTLTTTTKQINVAATTKNVYINLLTSVGNDGQEWSVRRESDTNQYKVIIKPTSGQKINGADSLILFAQNNNVTLKSDGANYIIVDRYNTAKANTPAAAEDLSNISSVTPKKRIYTQTDSVVSVTEYYEVTLTTAGTASSFAVKTPIPTTFTSVYDAMGVGAVTIVDDFTTPTTRKSASAVITSVNASNKVLIQLNDDADSGNTKRIVTLNYQYILK